MQICFAVFFPLSPSFYLFSLFPLFPFLLFLLLFLPFSKLLLVLYSLLPASFSSAFPFLFSVFFVLPVCLSFLRLFIFFLLFPSFFQITADSLSFASGFFLSFSSFPLSPSFFLFSLFPLFPFLLFLLLFLPFSKLLLVLYSLLPASFSFAFPFLFSFFVFGLPPLTYERRRKNLPVNGEKRSRKTV